MTVVLNQRGLPEPSPEIRRRLQAMDPRLDLKFLTVAGKHWSVVMYWAHDDRRNETLRTQEVDPERAFDIIGYLPQDCPVEQAPGYLGRMLKTFPREDVQKVLDRISSFNTAADSAAMDSAIGEVLDRKDPSKPEDKGVEIAVTVDAVVEPEPVVEKVEKPKKKAGKKKSASSKYLDS